MKFTHEVHGWPLRKEIYQLDQARRRLNRHTAIYIDQTSIGRPNPFRESKIARTGRDIEKRLKSLQRENLDEFEDLVVEDVSRNKDVILGYLSFVCNHDGMKPGHLVSVVFGPPTNSYRGAYFTLKRYMSREHFPHRVLDEADEIFWKIDSGRLETKVALKSDYPGYQDIKKKIKEEIEKRRKFANMHARDIRMVTEILEEDYHIEISEEDVNYWDDSAIFASIDPEEIACYRPPGQKKYMFFDGELTLTAIHEIIGHGFSKLLGRKVGLPRGLRPSIGEYVTMVHGLSDEGRATLHEDLAIKDMFKNPKKWGLTPKDAQITDLLNQARIPGLLTDAVYAFLDLQYRHEHEEKEKVRAGWKRHGVRILADWMGIERYRKDPNILVESSLDEFFEDFTFFFGNKRIHEIYREVIKQKVPIDKAITAVSCGDFCSEKSQRRFVQLYLERLGVKVRL